MVHWQDGWHGERKSTQSLIVQVVDDRDSHGNAPYSNTMDQHRPPCLRTTSTALYHQSLSVLAGHQQREKGKPRWQSSRAIGFKDIC
jgi:hypothetical protein